MGGAFRLYKSHLSQQTNQSDSSQEERVTQAADKHLGEQLSESHTNVPTAETTTIHIVSLYQKTTCILAAWCIPVPGGEVSLLHGEAYDGTM